MCGDPSKERRQRLERLWLASGNSRTRCHYFKRWFEHEYGLQRWRRYKSLAENPGGAKAVSFGDKLTEIDKILSRVRADIKRFRRELREFSGSPGSDPEYKKFVADAQSRLKRAKDTLDSVPDIEAKIELGQEMDRKLEEDELGR